MMTDPLFDFGQKLRQLRAAAAFLSDDLLDGYEGNSHLNSELRCDFASLVSDLALELVNYYEAEQDESAKQESEETRAAALRVEVPA